MSGCGHRRLMRQQPMPATIEKLDHHRARITLSEPQGAVSPGQACVAYIGDRMLGGGWITNA